MFKIWIPIVIGVIFFPVISTKIKDLEHELTGLSSDKNGLNEVVIIKNKIKNYKYLAIISFIIICILMLLFMSVIPKD